MTTSVGQPGQTAYGIPAKSNDTAKQIRSLIQTLNAKSVQVAALVQSATGLIDAAKSDPLAADLSPTSAITEGTSAQLPTSAAAGDVFLLSGTPPQLYICQTAYSSGGTLAGNWALDTDARTIAVVMGLFATSRSLTKTLGAYQTTLSGSSPTGTPASNQRWVQVTPWPVEQSSTVAAAWEGSTGSWVAVTQVGGEWPDWVNFAYANAVAANIGNLFASYATITYLNANYTTTTDLDADYAKITDLAAGTLAIGGTATFGSTTVDGVISTANTASSTATTANTNASSALTGLNDKLSISGANKITGAVNTNGTTGKSIKIDGSADLISFLFGTFTAGSISAYSDSTYGDVMKLSGLSLFDSEVIVEGVLQALSNLLVTGTITCTLGAAGSGANFVRSSGGQLYERTVAQTQSDLGISAERFKTNVADLDFPLEDGYALRPVTFTLTYPDGSVDDNSPGFIADNTPESLADTLVTYFDETDGAELAGQVKGFRYLAGISAVDHRLIQDLNARLTALESKETGVTQETSAPAASGGDTSTGVAS